MESSFNAQEVGRLYLERGDVLKAVSVLEPLAESALAANNHEHYLDTLHMLFRCYAELLDFEKIHAAKERLKSLVVDQGIHLTGKTYYTLGLCSSYKNDHETALDYCQKALAQSLKEDNKESVCLAILGLAISYYNLDRLEDSLKEIYNLQVFMNVMDLPQIRLSTLILKGQIHRKMKQHDRALEILWQAYEHLKADKNFYAYLSLLYGLALTYKEAGAIEEARGYLRFAQKSIDKGNLRRLSGLVDELLGSLGEEAVTPYDIVFNGSEHSVFERKKGRIDFNNQFILMDLLKLFLSSPGEAFSKEALVKAIWKQSYNPGVHDNKIYVTIKRLRQLIEPEIEKPRYIFRSKNGYYLNKDIKVLVEEEKREKL